MSHLNDTYLLIIIEPHTSQSSTKTEFHKVKQPFLLPNTILNFINNQIY